jgi:hypothetical protein
MLAFEMAKETSVMVLTPSKRRECRALFAVGFGFFGRMAEMLPQGELFDHISDLFDAVYKC